MSEMHRRTTEGADVSAERTAVGPADAEADAVELRSYLPTIDDALVGHLTEEAVEDRLEQLVRAVSARSELREEEWARLMDSLVEFAYQGIRSWLAVLALPGGADASPRNLGQSLAGLSEQEVDQLAEEVVTRAVASFREEMAGIRRWLPDGQPDLKRLLLLECALQLPGALRNRYFSQGSLDDPLEEAMSSAPDIDEYDLLQLLHTRFRDDRVGTGHRLRTIGYSRTEVAEIIDATLDVFEFIATRLGPGADGESAPPDTPERSTW